MLWAIRKGVKETLNDTESLAKDGNQIYSGIILYCCVILGLEQ